jgi:hypothetical protein
VVSTAKQEGRDSRKALSVHQSSGSLDSSSRQAWQIELSIGSLMKAIKMKSQGEVSTSKQQHVNSWSISRRQAWLGEQCSGSLNSRKNTLVADALKAGAASGVAAAVDCTSGRGSGS